MSFFLDEFVSYVRTRVLRPSIFWLWLTILVIAQAISGDNALIFIMISAMIVCLLIVQFRLWDDLADREFDSQHHPSRTIVVTRHSASFIGLCGVLAIPNALLAWAQNSFDGLMMYGLLLGVMTAIYSVPGIPLRRPIRAHLVLLKYPAFLWLSARSPQPSLWAYASAAVYLALSMLEFRSDSFLRSIAQWRVWLVFEIVVLLLIFSILV